MRGSEFPAHFNSIEAGQSNIEQNAVVRILNSKLDRFFARLGEIDVVGVLFEGAHDEARHTALVFDYQDPHYHDYTVRKPPYSGEINKN
jgi:hypothetical protein